jgi:6-phosphogluconolactonase
MLKEWDNRRQIAIPGDEAETIRFAAEHWIHTAKRAIQAHGRFAVALSGGTTPRAIFKKVTQDQTIDWSRVYLFWSDERAVPPNHPDSNYKMAMDSGFSQLSIPPSQIFRMCAESEIEKNAIGYEEKIHHHLGKHLFDLVMLGVGEDGHTASLFPNTEALGEKRRLCVANHISEKKGWRMTLTFPCIQQSQLAVIYALGASKQEILPKVLNASILSSYPASAIGTAEKQALWVVDQTAAKNLINKNN